jgi:hypothetical protein
MATNSALLTSHILANRCESSAPGGIRTPNPQIRSRSEAAIQQHPSRTKAKKDRWFGIVDRSAYVGLGRANLAAFGCTMATRREAVMRRWSRSVEYPRRRRASRSAPLELHATAVASISIMMLGSKRRSTPSSVLTGLHPADAQMGTSSSAAAMTRSTSVV